MQDYFVLIDGKLYPLMLGNLYANDFAPYLRDNVIDFTTVSDPKLLAELMNRLSFHVAMGVLAMEDEYGPDELIAEKKAIRRVVNSLDVRYEFFCSQGDYERAARVNRDFLVRVGNYTIALQNGDYTLRDDYDELARG